MHVIAADKLQILFGLPMPFGKVVDLELSRMRVVSRVEAHMKTRCRATTPQHLCIGRWRECQEPNTFAKKTSRNPFVRFEVECP